MTLVQQRLGLGALLRRSALEVRVFRNGIAVFTPYQLLEWYPSWCAWFIARESAPFLNDVSIRVRASDAIYLPR